MPAERATGHAAIRDLIVRMLAPDAYTAQSIGEPIIAGNAAATINLV